MSATTSFPVPLILVDKSMMPSGTTSFNEIQSSACLGDKDEASEKKSSPESKPIPGGHPTSTEFLCSGREVSASTSPGKRVAPVPASSALSPCLAGGSTAATPSPLPDEDFREEALPGSGTALAASMPQPQHGHFDKEVKQQTDDTETDEYAGHSSQRQAPASYAEVGEESGGSRGGAIEVDAEQSHQRGVTETQNEDVMEALRSTGLSSEAGAATEHVDQMLLPKARMCVRQTNRENTNSIRLLETDRRRGELLGLDRRESLCDESSSPTSVPPAIFDSEERPTALHSAETPQLPAHHNVEHDNSSRRRKEMAARSARCSDIKIFNSSSARPKSAVCPTSNSPTNGERGGNRNKADSRQAGATTVVPSDVSAAASPASSAAGCRSAVKPYASRSAISLGERKTALDSASTSCVNLLPQEVFMKSTELPQARSKARTPHKSRTKADISADLECTTETGLQDGSAQAQERNLGNKGSRIKSASSIREPMNGKASNAAGPHRYNIKTLLAARTLVESSHAGNDADDAFDKLQSQLRSRYLLVERSEERASGTPAATPEENSSVNTKRGLLQNGSVLPLRASEQPAVLPKWTDSTYASKITSGLSPPPPPPPPYCSSQLKEEPRAFRWQRPAPNSSRPLAVGIPAAALKVRGTSACGSVPLPPLIRSSYRSTNARIDTCPGSSSMGGNVSTGNGNSQGKTLKDSLNPLAPVFEPQGHSLLLRFLSSAAESTPVEQGCASSSHCQPCLATPCSSDTASLLIPAATVRRHPCERIASVSRDTCEVYSNENATQCREKCDLRTVDTGRAPAKKSAVPPRDLRQQEVVLPHLLALRPEQQQESSLCVKQRCQTQLQPLQQAVSAESRLHWPVHPQHIESLRLRQQLVELPHHQLKQHRQQMQQPQSYLLPQEEDPRQLRRQRINCVSNVHLCEPGVPVAARPCYFSPVEREERNSTQTAYSRCKILQPAAPGYSTVHLDTYGRSHWVTGGHSRRDDSFGEQGTSAEFMRSVRANAGFRVAVPVGPYSSSSSEHFQSQRRAAGSASVCTAAGGGLSAPRICIPPAAKARHQLNAASHFSLSRGVCPKGVGLDVGLAEVLDPFVANRMLLHLGKMLRLTHLQVLTVVRRASGAGAPLRLTDLPSAFLKEHNAVLDLRSLGLLHIREVIAGMGRSLLLSWPHQHWRNPRVTQQRDHCESNQRQPREDGTQLNAAATSTDAVGRKEWSRAAGAPTEFGVPLSKTCTASEQLSPSSVEASDTRGSAAAPAVVNHEATGGCSGAEVLLKQSSDADVCNMTTVRAAGGESIFAERTPVVAAEEEAPQSSAALENGPCGVQCAAGIEGERLRDPQWQKAHFTYEDEGELLLLEGEPLPSVMKELLQHLLVSLVADALHHVSPAAATAGVSNFTRSRGHSNEEAGAPACISNSEKLGLPSQHRRSQSQTQQAPQRFAEDARIAPQEIKAQIAKEIAGAQPCKTSNAVLPADDSAQGNSGGSRGGSDGLDSISSSEERVGLLHTRGIPLQVLPTLWQLKYGVRCNLPAMLETCGYTSLRGFIIDALPCLHFSASGTHVALRLVETAHSGTAPATCAPAQVAEKRVLTTPVRPEKRETLLETTSVEALPCAAGVLKRECGAAGRAERDQAATRQAGLLSHPVSAAAAQWTNNVSRSVTVPQALTAAEKLPSRHVQGVPAQLNGRSEFNTEGSGSAEAERGPSEDEYKKNAICTVQRRPTTAGQAPVAAGVHQGSALAPDKHTDAKAGCSIFRASSITNEIESKPSLPTEKVMPSDGTASPEQLPDSCLPVTTENAPPSVACVEVSSVQSAAEVGKKECVSPSQQRKMARTGSFSKLDQQPPLPTLLACTLLEESPAKRMQHQEQTLKSPCSSSCTNKLSVLAEGSKNLCKSLLDTAAMKIEKADNEGLIQRQQLQQQRLPDDQSSPHKERAPTTAAAPPREALPDALNVIAPETGGQLEQGKQLSHACKRTQNGKSLSGVPCNSNVESVIDGSFPAEAAAVLFGLQNVTTAGCHTAAASKGGGVTGDEDEKLGVTEQTCSAQKTITSSKRSSTDEAPEAGTKTAGTARDVLRKRPATGGHPAAAWSLEAKGITLKALAPPAGGAEAACISVEAGCSATSLCAGRGSKRNLHANSRDVVGAERSSQKGIKADDAASTERAKNRISTHSVSGNLGGEEKKISHKSTVPCGSPPTERAPAEARVKAWVEKPVQVFAPQSRLHLHCMLYEVVATGCEKRGRAWARGEDLIELEEEVRQREAASTQLQRLQQLRKHQQQQLFQQMVKKKKQLLGESHRIIKQQQDVPAKKESDPLQLERKAAAGKVAEAFSDNQMLKKTATNRDEADWETREAARLTNNECSSRSSRKFATRASSCASQSGAQQGEEDDAAEATNEKACRSTSTQAVKDASHLVPEESSPLLSEEAGDAAAVPERSDRVTEKKDKATTKRKEESPVPGDAESLLRHIGDDTHGLKQSSEVVPERATTTQACSRTTASLDPRALKCAVRSRSPFSGASAVEEAVKLPDPEKETTLREQQGGESSSSSDGSTSSAGALASPTGLLLDEGIRLLMDERLVRRKLKKKAKKEKKKRKKMKLRALEMQEREQRRLLGLVDQLVELREEKGPSHAVVQPLLAGKDDLTCTAANGAGPEAFAKLESPRAQKIEKPAVPFSSVVRVASVLKSTKDFREPPTVPSPAGTSLFRPSVGAGPTASSHSAPQQKPVARSAPKAASQSNKRQQENLHATKNDFEPIEEDADLAESPNRSSLERSTASVTASLEQKHTVPDTTSVNRTPEDAVNSTCMEMSKKNGDAHVHTNSSLATVVEEQHLSSTCAPTLYLESRAFLSPPQRPSGPLHESKRSESHVDEVQQPPHAFRQQLQQEFAPLTLPQQPCSTKQQGQGGTPLQQQASLSLLSSTQLAEELRRYRNRSVGMLVSAIKGEWQRRFRSQVPSLSACMSSFKIKQVKTLLMEVPNLLILGSGGTMRVSTIEHALQFCRPFPPPSAFIASPSGKRIIYPMTMTPSSSLFCFRAHIYTHDSQSNIPFPLADVEIGTDNAAALVEPALAVSAADCALASAGKDAHPTRDQKTFQKQKRQEDFLQKQGQTPKTLSASQQLQKTLGEPETGKYQTREKKQSCCTAPRAPTHPEQLRDTEQMPQQRSHSAKASLNVECVQAAKGFAKPCETIARPKSVQGESRSSILNCSGDFSAEGHQQNKEDGSKDKVEAATDSFFNKQKTASLQQGGRAAASVPATSEARSSTEREMDEIEAPSVKGASAQTDPAAAAEKVVSTPVITEDGTGTETNKGREPKQLSEHARADQEANRVSKQQKQQQEPNPYDVMKAGKGEESIHNTQMQERHLCLRRLHEEAFMDLKRTWSKLQRGDPASDEVQGTEEIRKQQRMQLQRCLVKLLLSIVEYRCCSGFVCSAKENTLPAVSKCQHNEETVVHQQHSLSDCEKTAGAESPAAERMATVATEKSSGCSHGGTSSTDARKTGDTEESEYLENTTAWRAREVVASERTTDEGPDAAADAEAEEKELAALRRDLFMWGIGKREEYDRALVRQSAAVASEPAAGVLEAKETSQRGEEADERGAATVGVAPKAAAWMESHERSSPSHAAAEQQQQHHGWQGQQQRQQRKGLRTLECGTSHQRSGEEQLQTGQCQQKEEAQELPQKGLGEKEKPPDQEKSRNEETSSCCTKEIAPGTQGRASATDTEASEKVIWNRVAASLFATPAEIRELQKLGINGVPLREVLRDWRRLCSRLYQELDCTRRCSVRTADAGIDSCSLKPTGLVDCDRTTFACSSRFTNSSRGHRTNTNRLSPSAPNFSSALLAAAGWSSVLRGFLVHLSTENENATRRLSLVCDEGGELDCYYAGSPTSFIFRQAPRTPAAGNAVVQASKACTEETQSQGQPNGMQHAAQSLQPHQQAAHEEERRMQHQQRGDSACFPFPNLSSNACTDEVPGTDGGALTQRQKHDKSLEQLPVAHQEKHSKPERKTPQRQSQQQQDLPHAVYSKSSDANATLLRDVTTSAEVRETSQQHRPMVQKVDCKSTDNFTPAATNAASALQGRGSQVVVPGDTVSQQQRRFEQQHQHETLPQCSLYPQLAEPAQGDPVQQQHLQLQGQQQVLGPLAETHQHPKLALQYVLHQRLQQSLKARGVVPSFCSNDAAFTPQTTEQCRLSGQRSCPPYIYPPATAARSLHGQPAATVVCLPYWHPHLQQNLNVMQVASERQQQYHDFLGLEGGVTLAHCTRQLHMFQQQAQQEPQQQQPSQLEMLHPQGIFVQEPITSRARSPPKQQNLQQNRQEQKPPQQLLRRLQRKRNLLLQSQQQTQHCGLPQQSLQSSKRLLSCLEAIRESNALPALALQQLHPNVPRVEATYSTENELHAMSSENRPSCSSVAAPLAATLLTACSPSLSRTPTDVAKESRFTSSEMLKHCRLVTQPKQKPSSGSSKGESTTGFCGSCYSPSLPAFINTCDGLGSPCTRNNSRAAASQNAADTTDWRGQSAVALQYEQQLGFAPHTCHRSAPLATCTQEKQQACREPSVAPAFSLTQQQQQIMQGAVSDFHKSERNSQLDTASSAAPGNKGGPNFALAGNVEQLLTGLLLLGPDAAASGASAADAALGALAPSAPSGLHRRLRKAGATKLEANVIDTAFADQQKLSTLHNYYMATHYARTALPPFLASYGMTGAGAAPFQSSGMALGLSAAALVGNRCGARCPRSSGRYYSSSGCSSSNSGLGGASESAATISTLQQQRQSTETGTHLGLVHQLSKHQAERLLPQHEQQCRRSRTEKKKHACNSWGLLQQLVTSGTPSGVIASSSSVGADISGGLVSSSDSVNAEPELTDVLADSAALRKAENALLLLDQLQRQVQVQQHDSGSTAHSTSEGEPALHAQQQHSTQTSQPPTRLHMMLRGPPAALPLQEGRGPAPQHQQQQKIRRPQEEQNAPRFTRQYEEELHRQQKVRRECGEVVQQRQHATGQYQGQTQHQQKPQEHGQQQQRQQLQRQPLRQQQEELEHRSLQGADRLQLRGNKTSLPSCQHEQPTPQLQPRRRAEGQLHQSKPPPPPAGRSSSERRQQKMKKDASLPSEQTAPHLCADAAADLAVSKSEAAAEDAAGAPYRRAEPEGAREAALLPTTGATATAEAGNGSPDVCVVGAAATVVEYRERAAVVATAPVKPPEVGDSGAAGALTAAAATTGTKRLIRDAGLDDRAATGRTATQRSPSVVSSSVRNTGSSSAPGVKENHKCVVKSRSARETQASDHTNLFTGTNSRSCNIGAQKIANKRVFVTAPANLSSRMQLREKQPLRPVGWQQTQRQQHALSPQELGNQQDVQKRQSYRVAQLQPLSGVQKYRRQQTAQRAGPTAPRAASPVFTKCPSIKRAFTLSDRQAPPQQQHKNGLQQPPQYLQHPSSEQSRGQLKYDLDPSRNMKQCTDGTEDENPGREKGTKSQATFHQQVEQQQSHALFGEDNVKEDAPSRKQTERRDGISSYARRILAQLNGSSSMTARTGSESHSGVSTSQSCSAVEGKSTAPCQSPEAVEQLHEPAVRMQQAEQLQRQQQPGTPEEAEQSPSHRQSHPEVPYTEVVSPTARREAEARAAQASSERQTASYRFEKIDTNSGSAPGRGSSGSSFPPAGASAEQRSGTNKQRQHKKLQAAGIVANGGLHSAAGAPTHAGGDGQKGRETTTVIGTHAAPAFWRKK